MTTPSHTLTHLQYTQVTAQEAADAPGEPFQRPLNHGAHIPSHTLTHLQHTFLLFFATKVTAQEAADALGGRFQRAINHGAHIPSHPLTHLQYTQVTAQEAADALDEGLDGFDGLMERIEQNEQEILRLRHKCKVWGASLPCLRARVCVVLEGVSPHLHHTLPGPQTALSEWVCASVRTHVCRRAGLCVGSGGMAACGEDGIWSYAAAPPPHTHISRVSRSWSQHTAHGASMK